MGKMVIRRKPGTLCDVLARETWLEELAAKEGLFVVRWMLPFFAVFRKAEPKALKYRFEHNCKSMEDKQAVFYKECGWTEVPGTLNWLWGYRLFYAEPGAEELHTEGEFDGRSYMNRMILLLVLACLFLLNEMSILIMWQNQWTRQFASQFLVLVPYAMLLLLAISVFVGQLVALKRVRKAYDSGETVERNINWRKIKRRWDLRIGLGLLLLVGSFLGVVYQVSRGWEKPRSEVETMPYIHLAELLEEDWEAYPYNPGGQSIFDAKCNCVEFEWSPLLPVCYEEFQKGGDPKFSMRVDYLEFINEDWAKSYYEERLAFYNSRDWLAQGTDFSGNGVEGFHYHKSRKNENGQRILLRKGAAVVEYELYDVQEGETPNLELYKEQFQKAFSR